ncbi:MAG: hypothetical protein EBR05_12295, partial [Marivivens sp.]|nr:hypothetical protein [Marivivens sp.]
GNLNITGNITLSGTVDGRDVAADGTRLDTIENNADVTDATNVEAAGALMDSEVTNLAQVKAFNSADYATAAQGSTADAALAASAVSAYGLTLIDDADAATARGTLGLGTAATTASSDYATAAQGLLADSALQSVAFADLTATPTTLAGYGITDAATSAQGTLADSALQSNSTLNADNMTTGTLSGGTY